MKMNLLKSMIALAAFCLGGISAYAQNQTGMATVKMTYINGSDDNVDVAYGEIPAGEPAYAGYNKITGGKVELANKGWGVNNVAFLKVDASSIPGVIQKATLVADFQQIAARGMNYGVGYNDSEWSPELTWNTADRSITAIEGTGTQSTAKATDDVELSFDITGALSIDKNYTTTLLVYNLAAGAGYIKNPKVVVEYEPYEATTTKFDFEDGNKVFTDDSRITSAIEANEALGSNVLGWTCAGNAQNGYSFSHYDFTSLLSQPALVKVEFDYYNTKGGRAILNIGDALVRGTTGGGHYGPIFNPNKDNSGYVFKGCIFRIGSDKDNAYIQRETLTQVDITEEQDVLDEAGNPTGDKKTVVTAVGICDKWLHVKLMVNNGAKTVAWEITDQEGKVLYIGSDAFYADDANECTQIDLIAGINNNHSAMLDNLEITNYKSNAVFADYTIKYVDANGNELKASRTGNGQVGKNVTLLDSDKASFTADIAEGGIDGKMKYIYSSDDSETVAIEDGGTAVITVTFRNAEIYAAVLNCMIDGGNTANDRLAQFQGKFFEGDNYYVYPSRGYGKDGKYYFTDATNTYNGVAFAFPGSLNSRTIQGVVTYIGQLNYTLDESVAYYSDFERLALPVEDAGDGTGLGQLVGTVNNWWSFSGGIFDRFSQGRGVRLDTDSYVYTEPIAEDGTYMVRIYGRNDKSENCVAPYALGVRDAEGNVSLLYVKVPDWGSATTGESVIGAAAADATDETAAVEAAGIGLKAGYSLVVMNTGNGDYISLDDIKLTKVADYAETPFATTVTIGEAGYVTFSSTEAVTIPEGVEAYAAKVQDNKVVLTKVDAVPANTGVILKAAAGQYMLPIAKSADAIADNDLLVSDGDASGNDIYVLANKDKGVGFYKLAATDAVPAGKAYLKVVATAPEFLPFAGNTTGIELVKSVEAKGGFFNLAGQRVAQPAKGLYIVNGKKVVIK